MSTVYTADEVKKHTTNRSLWMVIRNNVYDVTSFVDEHPGGEDPLLEAAGQDATIAFDDVGHSADARTMLEKYKIGTLAPGENCCKMRPKIWRSSLQHDEKPWLTYEFSPPDSPRQSTQSVKSNYNDPVRSNVEIENGPQPTLKSQQKPVQRIVVPIEKRSRPRRRRPPPPSYRDKLKWTLLALGIAIVLGVAYKKYST